MPTLYVSTLHRSAVENVIHELQAEADQARRARGELPGMYSTITGGPGPDGRLSYIGVPQVVIDRLRKRRVPFDVR